MHSESICEIIFGAVLDNAGYIALCDTIQNNADLTQKAKLIESVPGIG